MDNASRVFRCFGGPLDGNDYALPAEETYLVVVKPEKPLADFERDELVPVATVSGRYKSATAVDGKLYMIWEGWQE